MRVVGPLPEGTKAHALGPILIRERNELPSAADARRRIGLGVDERAVYASFGGGGDPDAAQSLQTTAEVMKLFPGYRLVIGAGPLTRNAGPTIPGALVVHGVYPALEMLPAFDAAVTAAGYNAVHELMFAGIPSVVVPYDRVIDDQEQRARSVERAGAGRMAAPLTKETLTTALRDVLNPEKREGFVKAARGFVSKNGATDAARIILEGT